MTSQALKMHILAGENAEWHSCLGKQCGGFSGPSHPTPGTRPEEMSQNLSEIPALLCDGSTIHNR